MRPPKLVDVTPSAPPTAIGTTPSGRQRRRTLAGVTAWLVGLFVVVSMVVATVAFLSAGSTEERGPSRFDEAARRCPPAERDGVLALIWADAGGREMCHYIDMATGRDVTPPFGVPAAPA